MNNLANERITCFGPANFDSPLKLTHLTAGTPFVEEDQGVLVEDRVSNGTVEARPDPRSFELAGPRRPLFFEPARVTAAIVTCGGLCPGINDVIRTLVLTLHHSYGVRKILGVRHGYAGFANSEPPLHLTPEHVGEIKSLGGTILGTSRGPQKAETLVNWLEAHAVNMLFVIGGDGTMRGAKEIVDEVARRKLTISVVGLPKTIDNDFVYLDKSFGFETAFAEAVRVIRCAHAEAKAGVNGIGLVKLMGRESGFIAAHAALAEACVNFVLIPEVSFQLDGKFGLLRCLERRLADRGHAVIVAAEGAGQEFALRHNSATDASGNRRLFDIGPFLKEKIESHFGALNIETNLKYIDPSYVVRSVPANAQDEFFCTLLAQHAVHAAMAGKTGLVVGRWHEHFIHLPMALVVGRRRRVDPCGDLWMAVLQSTGQPAYFS